MGMSTSVSQSFDHTSGQDLAHKMGQERSELQSRQLASLYGGDVQAAMAGANRIRDIQKYLAQGGYDPYGFEVVPQTRLGSTSISQSRSQES